jgi:hypothetical protein
MLSVPITTNVLSSKNILRNTTQVIIRHNVKILFIRHIKSNNSGTAKVKIVKNERDPPILTRSYGSYTPRNEVVRGYTGFTMSVHPSVCKIFAIRNSPDCNHAIDWLKLYKVLEIHCSCAQWFLDFSLKARWRGLWNHTSDFFLLLSFKVIRIL